MLIAVIGVEILIAHTEINAKEPVREVVAIGDTALVAETMAGIQAVVVGIMIAR
jgi:hypothetical protein